MGNVGSLSLSSTKAEAALEKDTLEMGCIIRRRDGDRVWPMIGWWWWLLTAKGLMATRLLLLLLLLLLHIRSDLTFQERIRCCNMSDRPVDREDFISENDFFTVLQQVSCMRGP
jgi:hypothetical protein